MTRREFASQIAFEYVSFEREYAGRKIQPLDHAFAFSVGKGYCQSGQYQPRGDYRYLDWQRVAYEARRQLPRMRRLRDEFPEEMTR